MSYLSTISLFALLGFLSNIPENIAEEQVDLIEINHRFDSNGQLKFDQLIFYRWSEMRAQYEVVDYKELQVPNQIPTRIEQTHRYTAIWVDKTERNTIRRVHATNLIETKTEYDPEVLQRKNNPQNQRARLAQIVDLREHQNRINR